MLVEAFTGASADRLHLDPRCQYRNRTPLTRQWRLAVVGRSPLVPLAITAGGLTARWCVGCWPEAMIASIPARPIMVRDGNWAVTPKAVYFAADLRGRIKIGCSRRVLDRLGQLAYTHGPLRLLGTTPGDELVEHRIHDRFLRDALGGEWFRASRELLAFVAVGEQLDLGLDREGPPSA